MEESVRLGTASVPACVALSSPGGGRVVNLGSQRMADAVVSWLAMRRVERGPSEVGVAVAGVGCAVLVWSGVNVVDVQQYMGAVAIAASELGSSWANVVGLRLHVSL